VAFSPFLSLDDLSAETVHFLFRGQLVFQSQHFLTTTLTIYDKNCQRNFFSVRALFRNYAHGFIVILAATSDCDLYIRRKLAPQNFLAHRNQRTVCKIVKEREAQHVGNLNHRIFPHDSNHLRLMPPF